MDVNFFAMAAMAKGRHDTLDDATDSATAQRERRGAARVLVNLDVDYGDQGHFLFASIRDISATGIFVRTDSPEPPGTHLNLRFSPNGADEPLELEGEVIWINPYRPGRPDNLNPGMGVRFMALSQRQRHRLVEFVRTFAYLDDEK